jgi:5-methylcytosine-specific restriction endonuclease McrA
MPTIKLLKKKKRDKTISKQRHQDVYQDKRWKRLVAWKKKVNPLCERCESQGFTRQMDEVHHKKPFEWGIDEAEKESLAFDADNLESLCGPCHDVRHLELRTKY